MFIVNARVEYGSTSYAVEFGPFGTMGKAEECVIALAARESIAAAVIGTTEEEGE